MARVTVEDCLANVDNRFDLVIQASKRARQLSISIKADIQSRTDVDIYWKDATLSWDNDKPTVMALREIADLSIDIKELANSPDPVFPKNPPPTSPQPLFGGLEED